MIRLSYEQKARLAELEVNNGDITPDIVVDDAMNPDSPLHSCFQWDVQKAARAHWRSTARRILSVRYVGHKSSTIVLSTTHYVRDVTKPGNQQGYVSIVKLKTNEERSRDTVRAECVKAESALTRARIVAEVLGVHDEIDALLDRIISLKLALATTDDGDDAPPPEPQHISA